MTITIAKHFVNMSALTTILIFKNYYYFYSLANFNSKSVWVLIHLKHIK